MTEGQTSLNIKDYPFAFSITALFFPNLLTETSNASIFGVLLVGGMIGSLLTIINPGRLLMRYHYSRKEPSGMYNSIINDQLIPKRNLVEKIIKKNFKTAAVSPSITFETDKSIGMIYFIIILSATLIRSLSTEFAIAVNHNMPLVNGVIIGAIIGIIGISAVLINHHFGFNFKFSKMRLASLSKNIYTPQIVIAHFDRIIYVTIANLAIDFGNLINESDKWINDSALKHQPIRERVLRAFYTYDQEVTKVLGDNNWTGSFKDFEEHLQKKQIDNLYTSNNQSWNNSTIQDLYNKYKYIKQEMALNYDVKFSEALGWFVDSQYIDSNSFSDLEPKLRTFIDSRDWDNTYLMRYRIVDMIETTLRKKSIPEEINETWNV